ncbi:response regulator of zinc sigma-54-dependent two-component system [Filimonas lacunae]|nr:response regulator of zinc sigma-54-dependent two-component system [Filimonas lacunae]
MLERFLRKKNYEVVVANSGKEALNCLFRNNVHLVLCDYKLEDVTGAELLTSIRKEYADLPVIIITAYSDIKTAVDAMKKGAFDYVTKPLFPDEILLTIEKALKSGGVAPHNTNGAVVDGAKADHQNGSVKEKQIALHSDRFVAGKSPLFKNILEQIRRVAPTDYSVIIYGESGSGKEVLANEIHMQSKRAKNPFVAVDCGALSRELAGSELFGHEKGAFTGALNQKTGIFEVANGGTVFLDEIANLSYDIQVSLLRAVQERKIRRVGGTKDIDFDVRIIVASNEELWEAAKKGKFREDLFHRFNEFSIKIPPLRDRKEDVMQFATHFLQQANEELNKHIKGFQPEVEDIFRKYVWHGNLRELKNVIKRTSLLTDGDMIEVTSLPFEIINYSKLNFDEAEEAPAEKASKVEAGIVLPKREDSLGENSLKDAAADAEYLTILKALKEVNFNKSKAARLLNVDRKTLYNKIKQFDENNNR